MSSGPVYPLIDSDAYADFFHHSVTRSSVHLPLAATPTASPTCSPTFYLVCYLTLHLFSSLILITEYLLQLVNHKDKLSIHLKFSEHF